MTPMAAFPPLAEAIIVPVSKLTADAITEAGLESADYAVIEPAGDGVRVRAASVDEQLEYEQSHGLGHVTYSLEEFLAELDSGSPTDASR
jgi:hypothetical protein